MTGPVHFDNTVHQHFLFLFSQTKEMTHFNASSENDAPKAGLEMPERVAPKSAVYVEGFGRFRISLK
jgi:hypothetical protein